MVCSLCISLLEVEGEKEHMCLKKSLVCLHALHYLVCRPFGVRMDGKDGDYVASKSFKYGLNLQLSIRSRGRLLVCMCGFHSKGEVEENENEEKGHEMDGDKEECTSR